MNAILSKIEKNLYFFLLLFPLLCIFLNLIILILTTLSSTFCAIPLQHSIFIEGSPLLGSNQFKEFILFMDNTDNNLNAGLTNGENNANPQHNTEDGTGLNQDDSYAYQAIPGQANCSLPFDEHMQRVYSPNLDENSEFNPKIFYPLESQHYISQFNHQQAHTGGVNPVAIEHIIDATHGSGGQNLTEEQREAISQDIINRGY